MSSAGRVIGLKRGLWQKKEKASKTRWKERSHAGKRQQVNDRHASVNTTADACASLVGIEGDALRWKRSLFAAATTAINLIAVAVLSPSNLALVDSQLSLGDFDALPQLGLV